jgi:hypothetical protein
MKYQKLYVFACLVAVFTRPLFADFAVGSTQKAFFWTATSDTGVKSGCFGYSKINSVATVANTTTYSSSFWFPTYTWWQTLFPQTYLTCAMDIQNSQPAAITRAPNHFSTVPWFTGFKRTDTAQSLKFLFPLLPQNTAYGRYDYFTVNADTGADLEFYGAGDSIMVGTFVDKKPASNGAVNILARNAFIVELTKSNPLRIRSIRCNGTFRDRISSYLGYPLTKLSKTAAWYGIDFIDTSSNVQVISVNSITIHGTMPLVAQATAKITWKLGGATLVDSCIIYFSYDSMKTWSVSGKTIRDSSYTWTVPTRETSNAFIKVTACGHNGERVSSVSNRFSTTIQNDFELNLEAYANSSIIAVWNPSGIILPKARGVCLAYRTGSPAQSVNTSGLDTLMYNLAVTRDTITGLDKGTMYYFTAFIVDSSGDFILPGPDAIDSAVSADRTPPVNPFTLLGQAVDSVRIRLSWRTSGSIPSDIDSIGIWYNEFRFPTSVSDNASKKAGAWSTTDSTYTCGGLKPSTAYYFALFVSDTSGNWSDTVSNARTLVRTLSGSDTTSKGIRIILSGNDSQSIYGDSLRIRGNNLNSVYVDTIDKWNPPALKGFIYIGPAFSFRSGMLPSGASVTIRLVSGTLPSGYSIDDVRLYRYNIYTGGIRTGSCSIDGTGAVLATTDNLRLPFILMIDTISPEFAYLKTDTVAYTPQQPIIDTFMVNDNTENPTVTLLAGAGNLNYSDITLYAIPGKKTNQYITTIPAYVADPCSGVRGLFELSDGRNNNSVSLSRRIIRTTVNCDDLTAKELSWTPITVTAHPDRDQLSDLMAAAKNEETFTYNKEQERIIRWLPLPENRTDSEKWVEYGTGYDTAFNLAPGKLFWIKTKQRLPISYGKAVIPALIDTTEIALASGEWTDFSLPYNFSIYSGDIISATEQDAKNAGDSIELYQWKPSENSYITEPIYLPRIDAASDPETVFSGGGAFTAFNASVRTIHLRIPPVCTPLSSLGKSTGNKKSASTGQQWCIKLNFSDNNGAQMPSIFCAGLPSDNKARFFRCPPSFLPVSAAIIDPSTGRRYGHIANGTLVSGGTVFKISFENHSSEPQSIAGKIKTISGLQKGISAFLFRKSDQLKSIPSDSTDIRLAARSSETSYLVVGTEAFISDFIRKATAVFSFMPVTANNRLLVRYSLPFDVKKMSLYLFDLKGRRVASYVKETGLQPGEGLFYLNTQHATGYYIVQMRVTINGKKDPFVLNKRWLYVR